MHENEHSQEKASQEKPVVERLTSREVLDALAAKHQAVVDAFADEELTLARETELIDRIKSERQKDDPDVEVVDDLKRELALLDQGKDYERHYAAQFLEDMKRNPGDYYDSIGSPESRELYDALAKPLKDEGGYFVHPDAFRGLYDADLPSVHLEHDLSEGVEIPIENIVSADLFESWRGRGGNVMKNGNDSSQDVIDRYASMPTETAPGVDLVGVQDESGVFSYLVKDGGHRVAAARLRGDSTVTAKSIILFQTAEHVA